MYDQKPYSGKPVSEKHTLREKASRPAAGKPGTTQTYTFNIHSEITRSCLKKMRDIKKRTYRPTAQGSHTHPPVKLWAGGT